MTPARKQTSCKKTSITENLLRRGGKNAPNVRRLGPWAGENSEGGGRASRIWTEEEEHKMEVQRTKSGSAVESRERRRIGGGAAVERREWGGVNKVRKEAVEDEEKKTEG